MKTFWTIVAAMLLFCVGCDENVDPTDPEGAYNTFRNSLFAGDADGVWNHLSPSSQKYFDDQYTRLNVMDEKIAKYLPPTDHKLARRQAGSVLTDEVTDGKSLFLKVFTPSKVKFSEAHKVGSAIQQIEMSEDNNFAKLTTAAGEEWTLERSENDEKWSVQLVRSHNAVGDAMKWLEANETALKQTVEDLIEEETTKREKVIAQLMEISE